jgi:hypothetical protein
MRRARDRTRSALSAICSVSTDTKACGEEIESAFSTCIKRKVPASDADCSLVNVASGSLFSGAHSDCKRALCVTVVQAENSDSTISAGRFINACRDVHCCVLLQRSKKVSVNGAVQSTSELCSYRIFFAHV